MVAPLQEVSVDTVNASTLLELRGSLDIATARPVVTDCVSYAWRNADEDSLCTRALPPDFVHDYARQLDAAAVSLLGPVLVEVWAEKGYAVEFIDVPEGDPFRREPHPMQLHWEVWDEAVYRLDVDQVVKTADLVDVRSTYTDTDD